MSNRDVFYSVILQALDSSRDENGMLDIEQAALLASISVAQVAWTKPAYADLAWHRLVESVQVFDPYDVITPEERASFPLTPDMVAQNYALLAWMCDDTYSLEMRKPVGDRKRNVRDKKDYWIGRGEQTA